MNNAYELLIEMNTFLKELSIYDIKTFTNMYRSFGFINEQKINNDYENMKKDFFNWWISLDLKIQEKIFTYHKNIILI